jgi:hypothetical protein
MVVFGTVLLAWGIPGSWSGVLGKIDRERGFIGGKMAADTPLEGDREAAMDIKRELSRLDTILRFSISLMAWVCLAATVSAGLLWATNAASGLVHAADVLAVSCASFLLALIGIATYVHLRRRRHYPK